MFSPTNVEAVTESIVTPLPDEDPHFLSKRDLVPPRMLKCHKLKRCQKSSHLVSPWEATGHYCPGLAERPQGYEGCMYILRGNPEDWHDYDASEEENRQGHEAYLSGGGMICLECDGPYYPNGKQLWGNSWGEDRSSEFVPNKEYMSYDNLLGYKLRLWYDMGKQVEGTGSNAWMDNLGNLHTHVYGREAKVDLQTFTGRSGRTSVTGQFYSQKEANNAAFEKGWMDSARGGEWGAS